MQKAIDLGSSGLDVIHGELKWLMKEAEEQLEMAQEVEKNNDYDDALESMERKYWEGQCDALTHVYQLTYALSFAIAERENRD
jgi:hypothetical protein